MKRSLGKDVVWGIRWGLIYACAFGAIALVIFLVEGNAPFRANDITLGRALAGYAVCGLLGGAILGLFRPLARSAVGAAILGVLIAVPLFVFVRYSVNQDPWSIWDTLLAVLAALIWGVFGGTGAWRVIARHQERRDRWTREQQ